MAKNHKSIVYLILGALLMSALFFRAQHQPIKNSIKSLDVTENRVQTINSLESSKNNPPAESKFKDIKTVDEEKKSTFNSTWGAEYKLCFSEAPPTAAPDEWIKNLKHAREFKLQDDETTYHMKNSLGQETRLQILTFGDQKELRYFKVLSDGLPERVPLRAQDEKKPTAETITKYLNLKDVFWNRNTYSLRSHNNVEINVEEVNGQVHDFQYHSPGINFYCSDLHCQCRK